jgi:hypothetical protein
MQAKAELKKAPIQNMGVHTKEESAYRKADISTRYMLPMDLIDEVVEVIEVF